MFGDLATTVRVLRDDVLFRNIKGIRESQSLFDDLADDDDDILAAIAAELHDKPDSDSPLITRPFDYVSVLTFPFVNKNWMATRFSAGTLYGVWYGAVEMETTVFESAYHWRRFVEDSFPDIDRVITGERRVFKVLCNGILVDLVGKEVQFPGLVDTTSYAFSNQVGEYLYKQGQNGLLSKSARCNGTTAAVFKPGILSDPKDVCYLTYKFNPARASRIAIERSVGTVWMKI